MLRFSIHIVVHARRLIRSSSTIFFRHTTTSAPHHHLTDDDDKEVLHIILTLYILNKLLLQDKTCGRDKETPTFTQQSCFLPFPLCEEASPAKWPLPSTAVIIIIFPQVLEASVVVPCGSSRTMLEM
jgi:hypothetical protein